MLQPWSGTVEPKTTSRVPREDTGPVAFMLALKDKTSAGADDTPPPTVAKKGPGEDIANPKIGLPLFNPQPATLAPVSLKPSSLKMVGPIKVKAIVRKRNRQ